MTATFEERARAHGMVALAVRRGDLAREPCRVCGDARAVAHHDNYAKPLDVIWLCNKHHRARHDELGFGVPDPDRRSRVAAAILSGEPVEEVSSRNGISVKAAQEMATSPDRRPGRLAVSASAALRSRAIAIVAARTERREPPITGAALAAELEVDPRTARAILDELRAAELAPPAVVAGASGRRMAAAARPGKVVRLRQATIERLAEVTGRPAGEDVDAQVCAVLDRVKA